MSRPTQPGEEKKLLLAPCAEEYTASLKCLDRNNYDRSACEQYFQAYKECKKREVETRLERRRAERKGGLFS